MVATATLAKSGRTGYDGEASRGAARARTARRKAAVPTLPMLALLCEPLAASASDTPRSPGLRRLINALGDEVAADAFAFKAADDITSVLEDEIYGPRMIVLRRAMARHSAEIDWAAKFDKTRWRREHRRFAGEASAPMVDALAEQIAAVMKILEKIIMDAIAARGGTVAHAVAELLQETEDIAQALSDSCPTLTDRSGAIGLAMLTPIHMVVAAVNRGSIHPTTSQRRAVLVQLRSCVMQSAIAIGADFGYGELPFVPKSRRVTRAELTAKLDRNRDALRAMKTAS